jgi:ribosomal protein S18 acetylase RimI-like enzyme
MDSLLGIAWENILVGLLGGLLVSFILYIVSFAKDKFLEKKYPIQGTYLTTFEDIENGKDVSTSALAILKQRGKKVRGKTFLSNNRTWIIDGELTDTGNLHGVYAADDPLDKGIGNFFLKIANDRCMHGLWSGYDSENNIITSGKYIFVPQLKGYSIVDAKREHITQIIAIADMDLGKGFLNYQEVMDRILDKNLFICKVALLNKTVLGFCLCRIVEQSEICEYLQVKYSDIPKYVKCADKIGVFKTIAVHIKYQRRGIGYTLTNAAYNELTKYDIQAICSIAWKNGDKINAHGVLSAIGLHQHNEIKSFWHEDSITNQYNCPACGPPPCKCSAVLYFKAI